MALERYCHIFLIHPPVEEEFKSVGSGGRKPRIPDWKDRQGHSDFLSRKLQREWATAEAEQAVAHVTRQGVYLEFKSDPGYDLVTKSLEDRRSRSPEKQVRLLNVRVEVNEIKDEKTGAVKPVETVFATVYIPHAKKNHFLKKIEAYANEIDQRSGKPKNASLLNSIGDIRKALLVQSFWQDWPSLKPGAEPEWCEVWLSSHRQEVIDRFAALLAQERIEARPGVVRFPERAVKVVHASLAQLERLTALSDDIAEYRRAKDTTVFWTEMENREQAEWVEELLQRCQVDSDTDVAVCILYSAANALTLIAQAELQPYEKKEGGGFKTKEMHFYDLPWPWEVLLSLPLETPVQMRVTLSYFIEPGPGEIGWKDRNRYASHALRFDVNSPGEGKDDFLRRINKAAREEDEGHPGTPSASDHWFFGTNARNKGSIHSDIWQGTAADLAQSHFMAVYPIVGWWRERSHLGKWDSRTRYSFMVSITTPEEQVDIYTPVANQVGITVAVVT